MKLKQWLMIGGAVVIVGAGAGFVGYRQGHKTVNNSSAQTQTETPAASSPSPSTATQTETKPATGDPVGQKPSINKYDPAGLFNASYTRKLTNFTPWTDSKVTVVYRDFNADSVTDAFVWAKLPGTGGYSSAAVWTLNSSDKPVELWHMPDDEILGHSTWSVNASDGLENKSLNSDGSTDDSHTFHWQVTTTGKGFVLEPNI